MNTTLQDLANEYDDSIKVQQKVIDSNRKKLLQAQKKGNFKEVKRLSTLLHILYDEKSELEEKSTKLRNYYS